MSLDLIFELCLIPILGVLTTFLVVFLNTKKTEVQVKVENEVAQKYINMALDTIAECVVATNQTYVDSLKAQGKFDAEAQKVAFQKTFDNVLLLLTDEAKEYLAAVYGDLNNYLTTRIEAQVNLSK